MTGESPAAATPLRHRLAVTALLLTFVVPAGAGEAVVTPSRVPQKPSLEAPAARALVAAVVERYERARPYEFSFVQESYWALADTVKSTEGTLLVEDSGRIALTYGDGGRAVADTETLKVFVPQTMQFFVTSVDPADVAVDPARLLTAYEPDRTAPFATAARTGDAVIVNMVPRDRFGEPSRLEVTVNADRNEVARIVAHSSAGDRTTYRITRTRFGVAVQESDFLLERPADTELIHGSPFGAGFETEAAEEDSP